MYILDVAKHPLPGVVEISGQRTYSEYWPVMTQFEKKGASFSPPRLLICSVLDQSTVDSGRVSRGRSVAVAVGCLHFNGTSTALS